MPATRYGVSPWLDAVRPGSRPVYPMYRGDRLVPLVVIGGGLTGTMTAYACAAAGVKVLLLEADRLGSGGSGRASGVCSGEGALSFRDLERVSGRRVARTHFEQARRAVLDLAAAVKRLRIKAGFEEAEAIRVVPRHTSSSDLKREVDARRDAGLEAAWQKPSPVERLTAVEGEGGARLARWAHCDPYRLLLGFAAAAIDRGAEIYERSPVTKVAFDRKVARVVTADGTLTATTVIHCTGEPTSLAAALKRHVRPHVRAHALSVPLPTPVRKAIGPPRAIVTDVQTPPHVVRFTDDHRVLVSGADAPRPRSPQADTFDVPRTGQLMYELSLLYPAISGVLPAYGWSMPLGVTPDGGLCAGPHRNFPHQLFAFGTEHDPARAYLASRVLLRHVQGDAGAEDERLGLGRHL